MNESKKEKVAAYLENMSIKERGEFGNARGIRNVFETMVVNQANRLVTVTDCSMEQLTLIKAEDISWLETKSEDGMTE